MNYEELTEDQKAVADWAHSEGYDEGWHEGYDAYENTNDGQNDHYDDGYHNGFLAGVDKERDRVQYILNMMFESSLNMGKGQKAVFYREVMELLKPVDIKDYDPEDDDF